ncbi:DNA endonuclease RBBP8 isoform X2 [Melanotaenia boesemani]|uniref:DNA endonuclease RBBP8 isoform X2 n=1 Tax=Melanotaenia boesemani TaxID=1250792 RepID=UPI001C05A6FD|nr:DNA endonuclease RBBP8 isoform X2 [Melanotaenia boesemani]
MMTSSGDSSGTIKPADPFENLWRQLGECHQNALEELEAKVSKLKKDRCLDAQRLEVFYNRNQHLKEQNKTLQDTISLLEERLRAEECDRCSVLEKNLKSSQDHNLQLITKLKSQRNNLEEENKKLRDELQKLKASCISSEPKEASSPEQEEGVIPDSPILPSPLPVANKLKKRKHNEKTKHVRYAETPLQRSNNSLFQELNKDPSGATKNPGKSEVLVANTCELDASQISNGDENMEGVVAETCAFEILEKPPMKKDLAVNQQSITISPLKVTSPGISLRPYCCSSSSSTLKHSPGSMADRSPSLLPLVKRFSDGSSCKAKRRKEESDPEMPGGSKVVDRHKKDKSIQPELINESQSLKKEQLDRKDQSAQMGPSSLKLNVSSISPAFKKPHSKMKGDGDGKRRTLQDLNAPHDQAEAKHSERRNAVEPMWSVDPTLALSMYDSEQRDEEMEEQQHHGDLADTDCTWVSHSMLQRGGGMKSGKKANDSLDMLFDTTACGEYKSYNASHLDSSQHCGEDENTEEEKEEEEEEEGDDYKQDAPDNSPRQHKAGRPTFAHVAVIRKKDERRKLKGTTCKECDVYYAHLPEEEKQKKLSACSRHRFLYIPPCTPENFWEVGFPSTQTCIERGYIKEEKNPQSRLRRRQPLNALFSPKPTQKPI